ncbi:cAMP-regulated phosphoprotein 19-B [Daktulosphaira vitifoliae]|uniref:cAMP-regulated phosphoprotein 19-B n=1 Tax=Daktulosphaira vitifoliae TaxID=58002 RepID=UPI0021AA2455|nr:cAMP-regulated phosphoprotein 19-B [Daktulosphaira vitifoliae]XP_050525536.1 cAMP-regulated phosphoprotein 19-B [Daktulosphaira vitifoliae]XP_050525537.1 cAMP-regulated phosphoprotein 19-B [Daktulosphaira vitifoliae]
MADQAQTENKSVEFCKPKDPKDVEKAQEETMKKQYQMKSNWPPVSGHSALLQKRLAKGQKFFDSGDYQMARQVGSGSKIPNRPVQQVLGFGTGDAIPTPDTVPARKTSIIQPKFNTSSTPSSTS